MVLERLARVPGQGRSDPELQTHTTSPTGQPVGFFVLAAGASRAGLSVRPGRHKPRSRWPGCGRP